MITVAAFHRSRDFLSVKGKSLNWPGQGIIFPSLTFRKTRDSLTIS